MQCRICGSDMEYKGVDDGGGDYGESICEQWECLNCGSWDEINCVDYEYVIDLEDENFIQGYADGQEFENPYPPEDDQNHIADMGDLPF